MQASGSLAFCNGIADPFVISYRTNTSWQHILGRSPRSALPMTTGIDPVATGMPLASPDERSRMPIPAFDGVGKPIFEDLHIIDMVSLHRSSDQNALHRFGHVEPRACTRSVEEPNAMFMTPTHPIVAVMARQIIQDEQHP